MIKLEDVLVICALHIMEWWFLISW